MFASVFGLVVAIGVGLFDPASPLELLGRFSTNDLPEASGIVKSRRYEGIFWCHNDSGNRPVLFAIGRDGKVVRRCSVAAVNLDWEDIAIDDEGHLYLGDIGNNGGRLPIRVIHQLQEPDPAQPLETPLKVLRSTYYTFPNGRRFDAESLIFDRGRALLIAKTFDHQEARIYSLPLVASSPAKPLIPEPAGILTGFREPATGADLSANGRMLAVCSDTVTRIYQREHAAAQGDDEKIDRVAANPWKLVAELVYPDGSYEGICWDGDDLLLVSEEQTLSRISGASWKLRSTN